jgi:hypothetical protein
MSDVSSYEFKALEDRVERLEKEEKRRLEEQMERSRRRTELLWHWSFFAMALFYAVVLAVLITRKVVAKD